MGVKPCSSPANVNRSVIRIALYGFIKIRDSGCVLSEFSLGEASVVEGGNTIRVKTDCHGIGINGFLVEPHLVE